MTTIVAGYLQSPEGQAAIEKAIEEAVLRQARLIVVHSERGGHDLDDIDRTLHHKKDFERLTQKLEDRGIDYQLRGLVRGNSPAEDLMQVAEEEDARLIVLGLRRRSPVGKLVLGSNAQEVLLHANCPVLAVKAPQSVDRQNAEDT